MTWTDRYLAELKRDRSRHNHTVRERPDPPLCDRAMTLRRRRFGIRAGAYVYMFHRSFGKRPYVDRKFLGRRDEV